MFFIISISALIIGVYIVDHNNEERLFGAILIFAVFLVIGVMARTLIANLASHWIED